MKLKFNSTFALLSAVSLMSNPYLAVKGKALFELYPYAGDRFYQNVQSCDEIDPWSSMIMVGIQSMSQHGEFVDWVYKTACDSTATKENPAERVFSFAGEEPHVMKAYYNNLLCNIHRYYEPCDKYSAWDESGNGKYTSFFGENNDWYRDLIVSLAGSTMMTNYAFVNQKYYPDGSCIADETGNLFDKAGTGEQAWIAVVDMQQAAISDPYILPFIENHICNQKCSIYRDSYGDVNFNEECDIRIGDVTVPIIYDENICKIYTGLHKCVKGPSRDTISENKTGVIVGGVIGGIAGVALICAGGWFGYKWYRNHGGHNEANNAEV